MGDGPLLSLAAEAAAVLGSRLRIRVQLQTERKFGEAYPMRIQVAPGAAEVILQVRDRKHQFRRKRPRPGSHSLEYPVNALLGLWGHRSVLGRRSFQPWEIVSAQLFDQRSQ